MIIKIILLIFFILLSGFFSGSETSLFSLSNLDVKNLKTGSKKAKDLVRNLLKDPKKLLMTILVGNMFVNICSSSLSETVFTDIFGTAGLGLSVIFMTILILLFGEITPKTIAILMPKKVSVYVAPGVYWIQILITPVRKVFQMIADVLLRLFPYKKSGKTLWKTEELKTAIKIGDEEGILHTTEARMFSGVLNLKGKTVEKVMRARSEIFGLQIDTPLVKALQEIRKKKFSRIPVYKGDLDHIIGLLYIKDLINCTFSGKKTIKDLTILRKPLYVPESTGAVHLFRTFTEERTHMAIVLDEYGGVAGLVTFEDIIEEIIGEVRDKKDRLPEYRQIGIGMYEISAQMEISHFNHLFRINLEAPLANTIGGFVTGKIGRIPFSGESFKYKNLLFKVISAQRNKIDRIMVTKIKERKKGRK